MTLGVAAIADWNPRLHKGNGQEAIVLMADNGYDIEGARVLSPVPKIRSLVQKTGFGRCGWFFLFASDDLGKVDLFLEHVRQDTRITDYENGLVPSASDITRLLSENVKAWGATGQKLRSEFLVAGFDNYDRPVILHMDQRGQVEDEKVPGFWVAGIGGPYALTRLLWHNTRPTDPLHEVIYKCWDAKKHSEKAVARGTDGWVLFCGCEQPQLIPTDIAKTIGETFDALESPVFWPYPRKLPPEGWAEKLRDQTKKFRDDAPRRSSP